MGGICDTFVLVQKYLFKSKFSHIFFSTGLKKKKKSSISDLDDSTTTTKTNQRRWHLWWMKFIPSVDGTAWKVKILNFFFIFQINTFLGITLRYYLLKVEDDLSSLSLGCINNLIHLHNVSSIFSGFFFIQELVNTILTKLTNTKWDLIYIVVNVFPCIHFENLFFIYSHHRIWFFELLNHPL